jgi:hypothetical protein
MRIALVEAERPKRSINADAEPAPRTALTEGSSRRRAPTGLSTAASICQTPAGARARQRGSRGKYESRRLELQ